MKVTKVLGAIVSVVAVSVGAIGLSAEQSQAQVTSAEYTYIDLVRTALRSQGYLSLDSSYDNSTNRELSVQVGYVYCNAFDDGLSVDDVLGMIKNRDLSEIPRLVSTYGETALRFEDAVEMSAAAFTLCPQHQSSVQAYFEQINQQGNQVASYHSASTTLSQPTWEGSSWAVLTASNRNSQINVRSTPSMSASSPHYGTVGDRVLVTDVERVDGYDWFFVGFPGSGATGWVRGDFVDFD